MSKILAEEDIQPLMNAFLVVIPNEKQNQRVRGIIKSKLESLYYCAPDMVVEHYRIMLNGIVQHANKDSDWWPVVDALLRGDRNWNEFYKKE